MRRYLVVAHQTLDSPQLLDVIRDRMSRGPSTFHLLVPEDHHGGFLWDEGQVRVEANRAMEAARLRLLGLGVPVIGEVGHTNPVHAVDHVLRREPEGHFDEIIISTLPTRISRWVGMEAPARIERRTTIPDTNVADFPVSV
jgi:GABA permease